MAGELAVDGDGEPDTVEGVPEPDVACRVALATGRCGAGALPWDRAYDAESPPAAPTIASAATEIAPVWRTGAR